MDNGKIDELIAEKVLGWIKPPATSVLKPMWVAPPMGTVFPELPKFSTNIKDAWLIVDKWAKEGRYFSIHKWIDGQYVVTLETDVVKDNFELQKSAETAPMAICLAALKSLGFNPNFKRTYDKKPPYMDLDDE